MTRSPIYILGGYACDGWGGFPERGRCVSVSVIASYLRYIGKQGLFSGSWDDGDSTSYVLRCHVTRVHPSATHTLPQRS